MIVIGRRCTQNGWLYILELRVPTIKNNRDLFKEIDLDSILRVKTKKQKNDERLDPQTWFITETLVHYGILLHLLRSNKGVSG